MLDSVLFDGLEVFATARIDTLEESKEGSLVPGSVPIDRCCFYS